MPGENVIHKMSQLSQCFASGSRPLPAQEDYVPLKPFICFSMLAYDWIVPLDEAAELIEIQDYTPLPGVQPWVLGVSNIRGKLLPLVDFAQFLGGQLATVQRVQRIVVLDRLDTFVGLAVDEIRGMRHFRDEDFTADHSHVSSAIRPYVSGFYRADDGSSALLFSPDALLENPLFQDVALS